MDSRVWSSTAIRKVLIGVFAITLLASGCGGSGGGGSWITVDPYTETTLETEIVLSGGAFVGGEYSGSSSIVSWENITSGSSNLAANQSAKGHIEGASQGNNEITFGQFILGLFNPFLWATYGTSGTASGGEWVYDNHSWGATVPLAAGENTIVITACGDDCISETIVVTHTDHEPILFYPLDVAVSGSQVSLSVSLDNGGVATDVWFEWGTDYGLDNFSSTSIHAIGSSHETHSISEEIYGLIPSMTYYFRVAIASNFGTATSDIKRITTPGLPPVIKAENALHVSAHEADLSALVNPNGLDINVLFYYGLSPQDLDHVSKTLTLYGTIGEHITTTIRGLSPDTMYYYRAEAENSEGSSASKILSFSTLPLSPPTIQTGEAIVISEYRVTLHGTVNPKGLNTFAWFEWGTDPDLSDFSKTPNGTFGYDPVDRPFYRYLSDLKTGAIYYYRAAGYNSSGEIRGAILNFETPGPKAITEDATEVGAKIATLNARLLTNGEQVTYFFEWGMSPDQLFARTSRYVQSPGTNEVNVNFTLSDLAPDSTYYYRAMAYNSSRVWSEGPVREFTTVPMEIEDFWARTFGMVTFYDHYASVRSIEKTLDDGYILAGSMTSRESFGRNRDGSWSGKISSMWVARLDPVGNIVWQRSYFGDRVTSASGFSKRVTSVASVSIHQAADKGFVLAGNIDGIEGDAYHTDRIIVMKLDEIGEMQWQKRINIPGKNNIMAIEPDRQGGHYVLGSNWMTRIDGEGNIVWQKTLDLPDSERAYTTHATKDGGCVIAGDSSAARLDSRGTLVWAKRLTGYPSIKVTSARETIDGGYVLAGSGADDPYAPDRETFVMKINGNGELVWQWTYTNESYPKSIRQTVDGGFVMGGQMLSHLDSTGQVLWQKVFDGFDISNNVRQVADGGFVVAGWIYGQGGYNSNATVLKTTPTGMCPPLGTDVSIPAVNSNLTLSEMSISVSDLQAEMSTVDWLIEDDINPIIMQQAP